jgi:hypothetical protein
LGKAAILRGMAGYPRQAGRARLLENANGYFTSGDDGR